VIHAEVYIFTSDENDICHQANLFCALVQMRSVTWLAYICLRYIKRQWYLFCPGNVPVQLHIRNLLPGLLKSARGFPYNTLYICWICCNDLDKDDLVVHCRKLV
jgi:hypothetical protein